VGAAKLSLNSQSASAVQRVNDELLARLRYFALEPPYVLDLGAGACGASLKLRESFPGAQIVAADITLAMLLKAPRSLWPRSRFSRVAADASRLPFVDRSFDLVYSSLLLPFCDSPERVFDEVARVLKEGGLFLFASFGPDTLAELRSAWQQVERGELVNQFPNLPQLGDALMHSGLVEPVMDTERHQLHYANVEALLQELKDTGAQGALRARRAGLTGRGRRLRMIKAYEAARTPLGIPATFEVIFGAAFAGRSGRNSAGEDAGEVAIPVSSISRHFRR
jgi:malonyl-CoA O-methyltransferase